MNVFKDQPLYEIYFRWFAHHLHTKAAKSWALCLVGTHPSSFLRVPLLSLFSFSQGQLNNSSSVSPKLKISEILCISSTLFLAFGLCPACKLFREMFAISELSHHICGQQHPLKCHTWELPRQCPVRDSWIRITKIRCPVRRWSWLFYLDVVSKEAVHLNELIFQIKASVPSLRTMKLARKQKKTRLFKEEHQIRKTPCILYWQESLITHVGFKAGLLIQCKTDEKNTCYDFWLNWEPNKQTKLPKKSCQGKSASFGCAHSGVIEFVLFKGKKKKRATSNLDILTATQLLRTNYRLIETTASHSGFADKGLERCIIESKTSISTTDEHCTTTQ